MMVVLYSSETLNLQKPLILVSFVSRNLPVSLIDSKVSKRLDDNCLTY